MALEQVTTFALSIAVGLLGGFFYDLYRVIRGLLRLKKTGTFVGDIFFFLVLTVVMFIIFMFINYAEVRFYVILGTLLGTLLYFRFLTRIGYQAIWRFFLLVKKTGSLLFGLLKKLFFVVTYPLRILFLTISYPVIFLGKGFRRMKKLLGRAGQAVFSFKLFKRK